MEKKGVLRKLELGSTIAEYDNNLEHYFIDTTYVKSLLTDKYDIIIGSKGFGKTAMLMTLSKNSCNYKELENVKLVQAEVMAVCQWE